MAKIGRILIVLAIIVGLLVSPNMVQAHADTVTSYFVLIGGDGDAVSHKNNLFAQRLDGETLGTYCTTQFVRSISGDYTNETAQKQARVAEKEINSNLPNYDRFAIAAFSHGGQSLYFMTDTPCTDIFLLEATTRIPGVCNDADTIGVKWAERVILFASQGRHVHVYASGDNENISRGSRKVIQNIELYSTTENYRSESGMMILKISEGEYAVCDSNGVPRGLISTKIVGGTHGNTCVASFSDILETMKYYY